MSALVTVLFVRDLVTHNGTPRSPARSPPGCGSPCCSPTFAEAVAEGRGKAQADALRRTRTDTHRQAAASIPKTCTASSERERARSSASATWCWSKPAKSSPRDGEIIEGVASVNEIAITGESAPVIREAGGDRSAVTGGTTVLSDWIKVQDHRRARLDLHRPHDRAGRRRRAAEDAERARAVDPALRPDADLPDRLRDLVAARRLFRHDLIGDGAGRAARLPHSDDDRRPAVGHRHRRHGPADPLQCDRDLGPRGRGGGRRRHAAPRQDRHHHLRQSHGDRVHAGAAASPSASSPKRRSLASLADETPEGRSIVALAKGEYGLAEPTLDPAETHGHSLHRADPHFRRRHRRRARSAKARSTAILRYRRHRRRRDAAGIPRRRSSASRRTGGTPLAVADGRQAARRHPSQGRGQARHQASASRPCAPWASRP